MLADIKNFYRSRLPVKSYIGEHYDREERLALAQKIRTHVFYAPKPTTEYEVLARVLDANALPVGTAGGLLSKQTRDALSRDNLRFSSGHWDRAPWVDEPWFACSPAATLHSLHIPKDDKNKGLVAFADTTAKLHSDRFTVMRPGRYLTQYFKDKLSEEEIKHWAAQYTALFEPAVLQFIEGNDAAGWERVYDEGPQSCMKGESCVRVYAHDKSVLRLAYQTQGECIISRCIVREDKKEYIRVYPSQDCTANTALRMALEALGYTEGNLRGVLLRAIETNYGEGYVCPYLDSGDGAFSPCVELTYKDGKEYLVVGSDGMDAQTTSGVADDNRRDCDDCGDSVHEEDTYYVEHGDRTVCESCYNDNYTSAIGRHGHEVAAPNDEVIHCESDDYYYVERYASDNDVYQCEQSGDYYKLEDLVNTSRGLLHTDYCVELCITDSDGNDWAHKDDVVETHDGRTIHKDDAVLRTVYFHKDDDIKNDQTPDDVTNTNAA